MCDIGSYSEPISKDKTRKDIRHVGAVSGNNIAGQILANWLNKSIFMGTKVRASAIRATYVHTCVWTRNSIFLQGIKYALTKVGLNSQFFRCLFPAYIFPYEGGPEFGRGSCGQSNL